MNTISCSIDNYICDNNSICREERQYALYLSNVLRKYSTPLKRARREDIQKIIKVCEIPDDATIQYVFYEATFMRDFFQRNRRIQFFFANVGEKNIEDIKTKEVIKDFWKNSEYKRKKRSICKKMNIEKSFNKKLFEYCYKVQFQKQIDKIVLDEIFNDNDIEDVYYEEVHYGINRKEEEILEIVKMKNLFKLSEEEVNSFYSKLREMMNSKPDIAVIYENKGTHYLLFLECKFESTESTSPSGTSQTDIQWHIADFLCKSGFFGNVTIEVAESMNKEKKSVKVVFSRSCDKDTIEIASLIKLEQQIFK